jgi:hypothetical protein
MTTSDTRAVTLDDATSLTLVVERPAADRAVARLELAGRAFRLVATPETGGDGEPATWRAEAVELPVAGDGSEHALGWEDGNVGHASADAALEETAGRVGAAVRSPAAARRAATGEAGRGLAMTGRRDERAGGGPAAGAGSRRDLGGTTAGDDEITGGGATAEGPERADDPDRAGPADGGREDLPGDDQGEPA